MVSARAARRSSTASRSSTYNWNIAPPERPLHRGRLETTVLLAQHDLTAVGAFEVHEPLGRALVGNAEREHVAPERQARVDVSDVEFGDEPCPSARRGIADAATHVLVL